jgi:hypothetical protein
MRIRRWLAGILAGLAAVTLVGAPAIAGPMRTAEFFSRHEAAASHPDHFVRGIRDLQVQGNTLYSGWGSYDSNVGPIPLGAHDLTTGAYSSPFTLNGEEINTIRSYNGALYIPDIDPKVGWSSPVGYATNDRGAWRYATAGPAIHVFDVAVLGSELFVAGSMQNPDPAKYGPNPYVAVVKRSSDGGATWVVDMVRTSSNGASDYDRYYWLAVVGGKVYAGADTNDPAVIDVYSGGKWAPLKTRTMPSLGTVFQGHLVEVLGSKIIMGNLVLDTAAKGNRQWSSTGLSGTIRDWYVNGATIYALVKGTNTDAVWQSSDGVNWVHVMDVDIPVPDWTYTWHSGEITTTFRAEATSLAMVGSTLYLGTNFGEVWRVRG